MSVFVARPAQALGLIGFCALLLSGCSSSVTPAATPATITPQTPAALTATAGNGQVQLAWNAVTGAASYNLYYSTAAGVTPANGTIVGSLTGAAYTQAGLTNETAYYFVVTEVTAGVESAASNQATATPEIPIPATAKLSSYIPTQYIAKLYTEALGRAPDQAGWQTFVGSPTATGSLATSGCSVSAMETIGIASKTFFDTAEFKTANPDTQSRVMAIVRAVLNRDPSSTELTTYESQLNAGTTPANLAASLYTGAEFTSDAATICTSTNQWQLTVGSTAVTNVYNPDYSFGTTPAPTLNLLSSGISTYATLVSALSAAKSGSTVLLAQAAMIPVPATLVIPAGVTLETSGTPPPNNYTQMARLVRSASYTTAVVQVTGGATLASVWIDGQRPIVGSSGGANVDTLGGTGTLVSNNKSSDPSVGSNFASEGVTDAHPCSKQTISGNLLTGYSVTHGFSATADGMTMYCENLTITNNSIVDMADIAIVIFGTAVAGTTQDSTITGNTIVSAGNSMNAPIATDNITAITFTGPVVNGNNTPGTGQQYPCFAGTTFTNNTFWTGPYTSFDFGIMAGGRPFFAAPRLADATCSGSQSGEGPTYTNNGTGILSAQVKEGIMVDGMLNVTITNDGVTNPFNVVPNALLFPKGLPARACPATMVEMQAGDSGGSVYLATTSTANVDSCTFINNGT